MSASRVAAALAAAALAFGFGVDATQALALGIGVGFGVTLYQPAFGVAGGFRRRLAGEQGASLPAQMLLRVLGFFPAIAAGSLLGAPARGLPSWPVSRPPPVPRGPDPV